MSAFKQLFTDIINAGGDASKISKDMRKQMLKVYVKETHPHFLVSDSFFYVPAYFTAAAKAEFKSKFSSVNAADLAGKVILITNWDLEMKKVNSAECFTSYAGVEVRLIVHSFKPQLQDNLHPNRYPTNLYRDDEFKTVVQAFRHRCVSAAAAKESCDMAPLHGKGNVSQGIHHHKGDAWNFKEGNTKTVGIVEAHAGKKSVAGAVKVKGGAAGKRAGKAAAKGKASAGKSASKTVDKVLKFTPKKATPAKGKQSAKRSVSKKALPTPSGKKSLTTTDKMSMATFKQFLKYHGGKKGAKASRK